MQFFGISLIRANMGKFYTVPLMHVVILILFQADARGEEANPDICRLSLLNMCPDSYVNDGFTDDQVNVTISTLEFYPRNIFESFDPHALKHTPCRVFLLFLTVAQSTLGA